jgi:hypothetical protein
MKQITMLLTGFLLATTVLHAQEKHPRFFTELSVGPSFPVGKFASKTYEDLYKEKPTGLAKTGWGANVSAGYYLNRSFGFLLSAGYSEHKQDYSGYKQQPSIPMDPFPYVEFTAKSWKIVNVNGGAFFVIPLMKNHRLDLVTKLTAGIFKTAVPGYDFKFIRREDWTVTSEGTAKKVDLPQGFCYQAGVALKYKLGSNLHVLLDVNSFNATTRKTFAPGDYYYGTSRTRQYNLNTINALAGIGIDF